ncbi:MAG: CRTAC1 family protein [Acidobacteriota bacterium]
MTRRWPLLRLLFFVLTPLAASQSPAPERFVRFDNVAVTAGLDFRHVNGASAARHLPEIMSGGGLFFDYDNDGWIDLFLVDGGSLTDASVAARARHRLYRNRGNGTFEDATARSGIQHTGYGMGACAADYDNDGWPDLYVTNVGPNVLYHNNGGRTFTDATRTAGVGSRSFGASCAFADLDRDGDVDLFVTNYVDARVDNNIFCGDTASRLRVYCHPLNFAPLQSVLYRNNGDGTFSDVSAAAGIAPRRGNGLGVVIGDYDDDGWPDIFVANDMTPNFLYHNEGRAIFKEMALAAGVALPIDGKPRAGMGTDFADYNGDGRLDLFVTNHELEMHTLYRNLGAGLFADTTSESRIGLETLPYVGFGTLFLDYDNDGDLDLAVVNGHVMNDSGHFRPGAKEAQRKLLFRNDGGGRFKEVGRQSGPGFAVEGVGRALAAGDIDNDGDLDLMVTNNGGMVDLLRNDDGPEDHSLLVRLQGTRSNRSAIGARVLLTAGGATQMREVKAGSSYLAQSDLRVHFGLGRTTRIDRLEIRWPDGASEVVQDVPVNQIVSVVEGKGITERRGNLGMRN